MTTIVFLALVSSNNCSDNCSNYKEQQTGILKNNMNKKVFFVESTSYINGDKRVTQIKLVPTEDTYWVILSESRFDDFDTLDENFNNFHITSVPKHNIIKN